MTLRGQHLVDAVVEAVADYYGLPAADMRGPQGPLCVSRARHVAMYLIRKHSDWSYPLIGRAFGRDHSSVYGACRRVESDEILRAEAVEVWGQTSTSSTPSDPQGMASMIDLDSHRKETG